MCGIVGACYHNNPIITDVSLREKASRYIFLRLLKYTEERGKDATGIAWLHENGWWGSLRDAVAANKFVMGTGNSLNKTSELHRQEITFMNIMHTLQENQTRYGASKPRILLGHCRKKTVGSEYVQLNNHPITFPDTNVIGIHNGGIKNHDRIFKKLDIEDKRLGQVDSEALVRLFEHEIIEKAKEGQTPVLGKNELGRISERFDGAAAALFMFADTPTVLYGLKETRPMILYFERMTGVTFIVSEPKFMEAALSNYYEVKMTICPDFPDLDMVCEEMPERSVFRIDLEVPIETNESITKAIYAIEYPFSGKDKDWTEEPTKTATKTHNSTGSRSNVYNHSRSANVDLHSTGRSKARINIKGLIKKMNKDEEDGEVVNVTASLTSDGNKAAGIGQYEGDHVAFKFDGNDEKDTTVEFDGAIDNEELRPLGPGDEEEQLEMKAIDPEEAGILPTEEQKKETKELSDIRKKGMDSLANRFKEGKTPMNFPESAEDIARMLDITVDEVAQSPVQVLVAATYQLLYSEIFTEGYISRKSEENQGSKPTSRLIELTERLRKTNRIVGAERALLNTAVILLAETHKGNELTEEDIKMALNQVKEMADATIKDAGIKKLGENVLDKIARKASRLVEKANRTDQNTKKRTAGE